MGRVVPSGSLGGVMFSMLARNTRNMGLIPYLGATFPILITPMTIPYGLLGSVSGSVEMDKDMEESNEKERQMRDQCRSRWIHG